MSRKHKPNRRSPKHKQTDSDASADGRIAKDNHRARREGKGNRKARRDVSKPSPHRHQKHGRLSNADADTDGDLSMIPTPPSTPHVPTHHQTPREISRHGRRSNVPERQARPPRDRSMQAVADVAHKNFRFRNQVLAFLDQQRAAVESWADSVGAGGPAEPMDWQPEQERIVYFARSAFEDGCYERRWRADGAREPTPPSEMGSWAGERLLDGSMVRGAPVVGLGLVDGIE